MNKKKTFVSVSKKEYKSLLDKYDISIENISYEYITKCTNARKIEHIIHILRSGEEGFYPHLLQFAENKLATIKPNSLFLHSDKSLISKYMLPPEERETIENDLDKWIREIRIKEKDLYEEKTVVNEDYDELLPKIRNINQKKLSTLTTMNSPPKEKRISSCDYAAWDKFDVEAELSRMEIHEEQNQIQCKKKQQEMREREEKSRQIIENKIRNNTTNTELNTIAETERIKGNEAFKAGDYKQALELYNISLSIDNNITTYNNRAMAYIKLKNFNKAYEDCCTVLKVEPNNVKALFRRGTTLENLQERSKALRDFEAVLKIDPNNKEARSAVQRLSSSLPQKNVRMKIVNENENHNESQSVLIRLPFSYYRSLSYVDLYTNCHCLALPTSSYHMYPSSHPRNIHCIIGEKVERQRKLKSSKAVLKNGLNKALTKTLHQPKTECLVNININNNNNDKSNYNNNNSYANNNNNGSHTNNQSYSSVQLENNHNNKTIEECNIENLVSKLEQLNKLNGIQNNIKVQKIESEKNLENNNYEPINYNIQSPYEFLQAWRSVEKDSSLLRHAELLRSFNPDKFITVAGNSMDNDMWSIIINCLVNHFLHEKDVETLVGYLNAFCKVNLFKIIVMFMNSNDKKGLTQIFDFVEKYKPNELKLIREKYEC